MNRSFYGIVLLGLIVFLGMTIMGCTNSTGTDALIIPTATTTTTQSPTPTDSPTTPPSPTGSPSASPSPTASPSGSPSPSPTKTTFLVHAAVSAHRDIVVYQIPFSSPTTIDISTNFVDASFASSIDISTVTPKRVNIPPTPTISQADASPNPATGILVDEYYYGDIPGAPIANQTVPLGIAVGDPTTTPKLVSFRPNVPFSAFFDSPSLPDLWGFGYKFGADSKLIDNQTNTKTYISPPNPTGGIGNATPMANVDVTRDVPLQIERAPNARVLVQVYSNRLSSSSQPHFESLWTNVDVRNLDWSDPTSFDTFLNSLPDSDSFTIPAGVMKASPGSEYAILVVVSTYEIGHTIDTGPPFPSALYSVSRLSFPMNGD